MALFSVFLQVPYVFKLDDIALISLMTSNLDSLVESIPLASYGFNWLIPSVVGFK